MTNGPTVNTDHKAKFGLLRFLDVVDFAIYETPHIKVTTLKATNQTGIVVLKINAVEFNDGIIATSGSRPP